MNSKLISVGVPNETVLILSVAYAILFPWRWIRVIQNDEMKKKEEDLNDRT